MTVSQNPDYYLGLVRELCKLPHETGWVEFKVNKSDPQDVGEYISALANTAALHGRAHAYMLWGIENGTHDVVGTRFSPATKKKGNDEVHSFLGLISAFPLIDR